MNYTTNNFNSNSMQRWANLVSILAAFFINILSNIFPLNGLSVGEISNRFFQEVLIIPANYAFAIWGLIYLGLISFGIYQLNPEQRYNLNLHRIGYLLVLASWAQIAWIFIFLARNFVLSLLAMLLILIPLAIIYWRLQIDRRPISGKEKWLINIPLSIYLAWISVATAVNVAIALYSLGWNGWGISPQAWTVAVLLVAAAIAAIIAHQGVDAAFPLVFIWAFVAIAIRQLDKPLVASAALGLAAALGIYLVATRKRRPIAG